MRSSQIRISAFPLECYSRQNQREAIQNRLPQPTRLDPAADPVPVQPLLKWCHGHVGFTKHSVNARTTIIGNSSQYSFHLLKVGSLGCRQIASLGIVAKLKALGMG